MQRVYSKPETSSRSVVQIIQQNDVFPVLPTGCGKSLIFQLVLIACSYLHDQGFKYPRNATCTLVVVCPLSALIESHIQEIANHSIPACSLGDTGHLKHNREDASCSLSTGIPNTKDNLAATFCFFEVSPSNKLNFPYPDKRKSMLLTRQRPS